MRELVREDALELRRRRRPRRPRLTAIAEAPGPRPTASARGCRRQEEQLRFRNVPRARRAARRSSGRRAPPRSAARGHRASRGRRGRRTSTAPSRKERLQKTNLVRSRNPPSDQPSPAENAQPATKQRGQTLSPFARPRRVAALYVRRPARPRRPRGGQSGSGASQRLEQWRDAMFWSGTRMWPFSSMCGDVLDVAVRGQHALLVLAAEERELDLLALVLVRVVLHRRSV